MPGRTRTFSATLELGKPAWVGLLRMFHLIPSGYGRRWFAHGWVVKSMVSPYGSRSFGIAVAGSTSSSAAKCGRNPEFALESGRLQA